MYKLYANKELKVCCKEDKLCITFIELCRIYGEENVYMVKMR